MTDSSKQNIWNRHQPLQLIRFPSITKLQYLGEDLPTSMAKTKSQFKSTSNNKFLNLPLSATVVQTRH